MSVTAEERKNWYHAGPGDSFPIGPNGEQLKAAWDLAHNATIQRNIINYAKRIGKTDELPDTAQERIKGHDQVQKALLQKAKSTTLQALFHLSFQHEQSEGDRPQQQALVEFAHEHDLMHLLPNEAHGMMHDMGVHHMHDGMTPDHTHEVTKAYNPIGKDFVITKAWGDADVCYVEGWLSTPHEDLEHDIIEPEAFMDSMQGYFDRRAPISFIHERQTLPGGHMQKAAIVREGRVMKTCVHPTDPAEFEHFPGTGTGVYVRGVLNAPEVAGPVKKGNVGGFSFVGNGKVFTPRSPKGNHYTKIDPWIESTVAPYPINHHAVITVAKAYGLEPPTEEHMTQQEILDLVKAITSESAPTKEESQNVEKGLTKEDLKEVLGAFQASFNIELKKANDEIARLREEGVGSKATIVTSVLPNENPLYPLIEKAAKGEEWTEEENRLVNQVSYQILSRGMNGSSVADIQILPTYSKAR
jgi:hypothetical protein